MVIKSEVDVPEEVTFTTVDGKPYLENREVFISLYGVDRRLESLVLNQIPIIKLLSQVFYFRQIHCFIFCIATKPLQLF